MNPSRFLLGSGMFVREWVSAPRSIGAICPSSSRLAAAIARQVTRGDGYVLELGGGTGVVTQALLEAGVPSPRLLVIERSEVFAAHLKARFGKVGVIRGDAARASELVPPDARVDTIVSGLPLRSLPRDEASKIVDQWRLILRPGGKVIQFTYDIVKPGQIAHVGDDFVLRSSETVWMNLPPARIVTMQRSD
jgi:phosphatidylethanolamine/phosphatidyl-N-methylethanolamine N-methyltransferase